MLREINLNMKPSEMKIYLTKPNRQRVSARIKDFTQKPVLSLSLGRLNEIAFTIPYKVEKRNQLVDNEIVSLIKNRYLLQVKWNHISEWFIINEISDSVGEGSEGLTVHAFSLGHELKDKLISELDEVSVTADVILTKALSYTNWSVGTIDEKIVDKYRSFDVNEATVLDFLFTIADTYGVLLVFDSENKKINLVHPDNFKINRGLGITYGQYLKSLNKSSNSDDMTTRLIVTGKDGLSINRINPTGASYIESFSYFMYPFERDTNRNVIQSSHFMSDELCHAILDYEELIETRKGELTSLLAQLEAKQASRVSKQTTLFTLQTELQIILDQIEVNKAAQQDYSNLITDRDVKQQEVNLKQSEIVVLDTEIESVYAQINSFKTELSVENNFTPELIRERNDYIITKKWSDENYIDENELYEDAKVKFDDIRKPKINMSVNSVNFFQMVEEQRNWDKLYLGDVVTVRHPKINTNYEVFVTDMVVSDDRLDLTITDIQEIRKDEALLEKINKSYSSSIDVEMSKYKWNETASDLGEVHDILNNTWDATKRRIVAGVNESVEVSNRGIVIKNPSYPNEMLVATAGVLALSKDNGETWKTAVTPSGVFAEVLMGRLIAGENLIIENENGKFTIDKDGIFVDGSSLFVRDSQGNNLLEIWNDAEQNAKDYADSQLGNYVDVVSYQEDLEYLQSQLDGTIESWFYDYDPTMENEPASLWTSDQEKHNHLGDTFTNTLTGNSWRFGNPDDVYQWIAITDSAAQKALQDAAKAQDTADSKRRTFVVTPFPPYDDGDLWVKLDNGDLMVCKTAKVKGQSYSATDWQLAVDALKPNTLYNGVKISKEDGLVVTRNDNKSRSIMNATQGIKIQSSTNGSSWVDKFYADLNGVLRAKGLVIESDDGSSVLIDGKVKKLDLSAFTTIVGKLKAENIQIGASTTFADGYDPTKVKVGGRNLFLLSDFDLHGADGWEAGIMGGLAGRPAGTLTARPSGRGANEDYIPSGVMTLRLSGYDNEPELPERFMSTKTFMYLERDTEYTLSYWVYLGGGVSRHRVGVDGGFDRLWASGNSFFTSSEFEDGWKGKYVKKVFTFKTLSDRNWYRFRFTMINANNGQSGNTNISIYQPMLVKGNKEMDYAPPPEDTGVQLSVVHSEIDDVSNAVSDLDTYVEGAFKDGLISEAEAKSIEKYINQINTEKADIDNKFTSIYNQSELTGTSEKTSLNTAKSNYNTAHSNLLSAINSAISDGKTTEAEKANVDNRFTAYQSRLGELSATFESAINKVAQIKVENVKVGGRNIIQNGDFSNGKAPWRNSGASSAQYLINDEKALPGYTKHARILTDGTSNEALFAQDYISLVEGQEYTLSVWFYVKNGKPSLQEGNGSSGYKSISFDAPVNKWTRITWTFVARSNQTNIYVGSKNAHQSTGTPIDLVFTGIKLEVGNKASDFSPSPEDIKQYSDSQISIVNQDIADVNKSVTDLNGYIDGSFKDGVISEAEAKAIEKYLNQINTEKVDVDNRFTSIYNTSELAGTSERTSLNTAKTNYNTAHTNLVNSINTAIRDGKTTASEKTDVDNKFSAYHTRLGQLSTAFENAINKIAQVKAYRLSTIGLTVIKNASSYTNFGTSGAEGELYFHGFDENGDKANVDGFILVNGEKLVIPKQWGNVSITGEYYLMFDKTDSLIYGVTVDDNKQFTKIRYGFPTETFTPNSSHLFIGQAINSANEYVEHVHLYEYPRDHLELFSYAKWNNQGKQVRDDLRMTSPLPNSIELNENGITAKTGTSDKYARMDYRGFYAKKGAFAVERPDGYMLVNDGIANFDLAVQSGSPQYIDDAQFGDGTYVVTIQGPYARTASTAYRRFDYLGFKHTARYLSISFYGRGGGAGAYVYVDVRNESGTSLATNMTNSTTDTAIGVTIDLGVPTGAYRHFYVYFRTTSTAYPALLRMATKYLSG